MDVNIPEDAVPGEYSAAYTITTADGTPYTGDITLRVWNHKMPSVSSTYTAVTMKPSGDSTATPIQPMVLMGTVLIPQQKLAIWVMVTT